MRVALFIAATGKYISFVDKLIESSQQYFLPGISKIYFIFNEDPGNAERILKFKKFTGFIISTDRRRWPYSTMKRSWDYWVYAESYSGKKIMNYYTHAFSIDADAYFASEIKPEDVLAESVGVQHCRYVNLPGEFENNEKSACFIPHALAKHHCIYYGGGFYGGSIEKFTKINEALSNILIQDEENGIIPRWHDESALNRYFYDHPPTLTLSPAYHWPEYGEDAVLNPFIERLWDEQKEYLLARFNQSLPIQPKIILIDKNRGKSSGADELRSY